MKSAGGLGLLPDVPQGEKNRAIFRGPLLCCRRQEQVLFLFSQVRHTRRKESSPLRLARGGDPSSPRARGGDGSPGTMWLALSLS